MYVERIRYLKAVMLTRVWVQECKVLAESRPHRQAIASGYCYMMLPQDVAARCRSKRLQQQAAARRCPAAWPYRVLHPRRTSRTAASASTLTRLPAGKREVAAGGGRGKTVLSSYECAAMIIAAVFSMPLVSLHPV